MKELFDLVNEYKLLHPNAETPLNYFNAAGAEKLIEMLKNADGREIELIDDENSIDGGELIYVED